MGAGDVWGEWQGGASLTEKECRLHEAAAAHSKRAKGLLK